MAMRARVECSRSPRIVGALLVCGLAFGVGSAWAGQGVNATIFGQVTDESGGILPGVTVTVSSPALQVKQLVEVTNTTGEYRVTPLPLGTYSIEFTLGGFQTMRREGLQLTAGFVAKVDVALKVGAVEESVTVSGVSPVVDVKTTSMGTQITRDLLESVPTARNSLISLLTMASGSRGLVDTGGIGGQDTAFKAFGKIGQSWQTNEGVSTTSPTANNPGWSNRFDIDTFDEAAVQTIGGSAEAPTAGIQLNIIIKSGGNDFHGIGIASQVPTAWQGNNLTADNRAHGVTVVPKFDRKWDRDADVGGRIVRDKIWFYGAARVRREIAAVAGSYRLDGSQDVQDTKQVFYVSKGTAQLTTSQKLIGSLQYQTLPRDGSHDPNSDEYADFHSEFHTVVGKGEWQLVKQNKVLSLQMGQFAGNALRNSPYSNQVNPSLAPNVATWTDTNGTAGGGRTENGRSVLMGRREAKGTFNWYKPDLFMGGHDFKAGASYARSRADYQYQGNGHGNTILQFTRGVPNQVAILSAPALPQTSIRYLGTFFQDSWTIDRRLTLNLGVRYANDQSVIPEQCRPDAPAPFTSVYPAQCYSEYRLPSFNPVAPRLHFAYDVTGDAKTVIKGGYGRFYVMHNQEETDAFNRNTVQRATFRWRSITPNACTGGAASLSLACTTQQWRPGESDLSLNGPDFISTALVTGNNSIAGLIANPDLKEQGSNEWSLSLERELRPNFGMRLTGVYTRDFNTWRVLNTRRPNNAYNIPVVTPIVAPDGTSAPGNAYGTITAYDFPSSLLGIQNQVPMFINDSAADASYKTIEVAAVKRLARRSQLSASYTATKLNTSGIAYLPGSGGLVTPNSINAANHNWEWMTRLVGSYLLPFDVQVGANLLYQSGDPWARTMSVRLPNAGSITVNVEPIGSQRTPNVLLSGLLVEKVFRLPAAHRLNLGVDIQNLTNSSFIIPNRQGAANVVTASGPLLGNPNGQSSSVVYPILAELRLRYTF